MRFNASRLTALLAAPVLLSGLLLAQPVMADTLAPVNPPEPMPAFKLPALKGSGSDTDLRNKVTIIRFWASW